MDNKYVTPRRVALSPDKIEHELKLNKAIKMRVEGISPTDIAEQLDFDSVEQMKGMISRRIASDVRKSNEEARDEDLKRLDDMHHALWETAMTGDNRAMQTLLRIMEMRMRLMGLDQVADSGDKKDVGGVTVIVNKIDSQEMKPMKGVVIDVDAVERNAEAIDN